MCGISGIVSNNAELVHNFSKSAVEILKHRGPDEQDYKIIGECGLAHTRLSIVDLTSGNQPMKSSMQDVHLVFNGEIYGYKELRKNAELCGDYQFKTNSDTELLLALYYKFGEDFIKHLPGCFAFALWDNDKKKLICGRDRFGEKPFYYALIDGGIIFASEIKALVKSGLVDLSVDRDSVGHFLQFEYVNPRRSFYQNIQTLNPAQCLTFSQSKLDVRSYWNLPATNWNISYDEAKERLEILFKEAVRKQMVADVSVGAFLSGGIDSSTIVAVASGMTNQRLKTFAFKLDARGNNDHLYAEAVSKKYNTEHYVLDSNDFDFVDLMCKMPEIYDEPIADQACMLQYLISVEAKKHVKVVLAGEGGDELLAGYTRHRGPYDRNLFMTANPLHYLRKKLQGETKKMFNDGYFKDINEFFFSFPTYARCVSDDDLSQIIKLYKKSKLPQNLIKNTDDMLRFDLQNYLIGNCIVKTDRATMRAGLEARLPFLDVQLAEFLISLPTDMKIRKNFDKSVTDKFILRDVFAQSWPLEVRHRDKRGFGPPPFNQQKLFELANEFIGNSNRKIFAFCNYDYIKNKLIAENADSFVHNNFLMRVLNLSIWGEKWL